MRVRCRECGKEYELKPKEYTEFEVCECGQPRNLESIKGGSVASADAAGEVVEGVAES